MFDDRAVSRLGQPPPDTTLLVVHLQTVQPAYWLRGVTSGCVQGLLRAFLTYCRTDQVHEVKLDKAVAHLGAVPWPASPLQA